MKLEVGFELPDYDEYLNDHCLNDNADSFLQYEEYIEELKKEYQR